MKPSKATITFLISGLITLIASFLFKIRLIYYANFPEEIAYLKPRFTGNLGEAFS